MPFEADSIVGLHKQMMANVIKPPSALDASVPAALDEVVLRCLRPRREERYFDVVSFADALAPFGADVTGAQLGRIVRIASGMFRAQRLAELIHRGGPDKNGAVRLLRSSES
jgi:hypothetical protein